MTGIAVVASKQDAQFAESVRAGLQSLKLHDVALSGSLPQLSDSYVVLIWSAALEATHAVDVQALIGLWSEGRLLVARRDATPLPLGMRDLPSLGPDAKSSDVAEAVRDDTVAVGSMAELGSIERPEARAATAGTDATKGATTGSQDVEREFWRAIKDGEDGDDFNLYLEQFPKGIYAADARRKLEKLAGDSKSGVNDAILRDIAAKPEEAAKREAEATKREVELKRKPAEAPRAKMPLIVVALIVIASVGGGAYYYFTAEQRARQGELAARLEAATKASEDLKQAQTKQLEALKEVEARRAAEVAALKSGDAAKIKEAQEATKRAEAEAAKQAEQVKQREAAATRAREDAKKAADAAKQAAADKQKAEQKQEVAAAAPAMAPEPAKVETQKAAEAPKAVEAPKVAETPKAAPRAMSRSEREAARDEELARKALAAAEKQAPPVQVAAASAPASAPAQGSVGVPGPGAKGAEAEILYQQALDEENSGKAKEAIRIYRRAARGGSGKAAKRLGEIYDKGIPGVSRDYAESLQWYETARQLGETIELSGRREPPSVPEIAVKSAQSPAPAEPAVVAAAPPPAPVAAVPDAPKAAVPAPDAPKAAAPVRPPVSDGESASAYAFFVVAAIVIFAFGIFLWRRSRRIPAQLVPLPRPTSRAGAQVPADATMLFVSYSHKDKKRVEPIVSLMETMGRRVWMDRTDITGQAGWAGQIVRAIRECRAVVLMASPNSYSSDQVVRELYLAMNHKKTIVPIEIEPAELPDELQYILAPFQHHRLSGRETREVLGRALAAV
jgi:hypothetical protein